MSLDMQQISWPGWETVRLIGRGSFGAVYEIQRDVFGEIEKAALKVISIPQNGSDIEEMYNDGYDDESITSTFQSHLRSIVAEYSLMRKMNGHTNIVSCDDMRHIQHDDDIGWDIYIKMELLTPLAKALPAEIEEKEAIRVAKDICAALELCSKHNVIHRDIKPQNIFVSEHGDYKLGDFGIAKTVEKTMGGTKIGTYKYMAPEVYNNQPYGHSSDIYSLGLVLYWLLNERRMPFLPLPPEKLRAGMEEEARERRFRGEQLPPPAHGSKELKAIVLKACAYDPAQRYHTAAEMLQALENMTAVKPAPEPVPEPVPVPTPTPAPKPVPKAAPVAETAPTVTPAPKQTAAQSALSKPASTPEFVSAATLSPAAQSYRQHYQQQHEKPQPKTREQIAQEYRRNYQAHQEKQEKDENTAAESGKKKKKLWPVFVAAAIIVLLLLVFLLPKACDNRQQPPDLPQNDGCVHHFVEIENKEFQLASFRYIPVLCTEKTDTAKYEARKRAEHILETWNTGNRTEAAFSELYDRFSEDVSSGDGGHIVNADRSSLQSALGDWVFDASRVCGDVAIIETEDVYFCVYFLSSERYHIYSDNPYYCSKCQANSGALIQIDASAQEKTEVVSVSLLGAPTGEYPVGTTLNTANMVMCLTYSDGTTANIPDEYYQCHPVELNTPGTQEITVSFQGHTATFTVKVKSDVMSHADYMAAALDSKVAVETYVQACQSWWDNTINVYCQSEDGGYFIYQMSCSEKNAAKLTPGTKIRVTGYKGEWAGEVEIVDATFQFVNDGDTYIAAPQDVTALLGTGSLIDYQNEFVSFRGMTVRDIVYWDGQHGNDIYITLERNGTSYQFTVESYLTGPETAVYQTVDRLQTGDVVDVEGFLYWYNGPSPHITAITVTE